MVVTMNIAILEDRPMVMKSAIERFNDMGIHTTCIICYDNRMNQDERMKEAVHMMCKEYGIEVLHANKQNFDLVLDQVYQDEEIQFLFDMDLLDDGSNRFEERINVIYAMRKKEQENGNRIWFYTTGPAYAVESINEYFPDRNIPVCRFDAKKYQVIFDYKFIEEKLLG